MLRFPVLVTVAVVLWTATTLLSPPAAASPPPLEATAPEVVANIEAVGDQPPPVNLLMQTFYNASSVRIGDQLFLYTQAGTGDDFNDGSFCWGDQIVLWNAPWTYEGLRSPFQLIGRVTPCPENCTGYECTDPNRFAWGLGSVLQSPHDGRYYMLLDYAVAGVDFNEGQFQEIRLFDSADGYTWNPVDLDPTPTESSTLLRQSALKCDSPYGPCVSNACTVAPCKGLNCQIACGQPGAEGCEPDGDRCYLLQFLDVTLEAESDHWWGFVKYGTLAANRLGQIRITPDSPSAGQFRVELLAQGGGAQNWKEPAADGSIDFMPRGFLPDFDLNDITPTDDGHRLWGFVPTFDATEGCEDGIGDGSALVHTDLIDGSFTSVQRLESTSRPSSTVNATGRLYPMVVTDGDGNDILYSSSSDRLCEMPGSNWPPQGNFFVGLDIVSTDLSRALALDGFSATTTRPDGSTLVGTATEIGAAPWTVVNSMFINSGAASDLGHTGSRVASVAFDPAGMVGADQISLKAKVDVTGSDWVGLGFGSSPSAILGSTGQVWLKLGRLGILRLMANGNQEIASTTLSGFNLAETHVEIRYQRSSRTARLFVDGALVLGPTTIQGFVPDIGSASFQFADTSPDIGGETRLDRFELTLLGDEVLFADGFDNGTTDAWSSSTQ